MSVVGEGRGGCGGLKGRGAEGTPSGTASPSLGMVPPCYERGEMVEFCSTGLSGGASQQTHPFEQLVGLY